MASLAARVEAMPHELQPHDDLGRRCHVERTSDTSSRHGSLPKAAAPWPLNSTLATEPLASGLEDPAGFQVFVSQKHTRLSFSSPAPCFTTCDRAG